MDRVTNWQNQLFNPTWFRLLAEREWLRGIWHNLESSRVLQPSYCCLQVNSLKILTWHNRLQKNFPSYRAVLPHFLSLFLEHYHTFFLASSWECFLVRSSNKHVSAGDLWIKFESHLLGKCFVIPSSTWETSLGAWSLKHIHHSSHNSHAIFPSLVTQMCVCVSFCS